MKRPPGKEMRERPRQLPRDRTPAEDLLWNQLRNRRLDGFRFRNQMWLCGFIADFACVEAKVVIEADGGQHRFAADYDAHRSVAFAAKGYRTLRSTNDEILGGLHYVLGNIRDVLALTLPPGCAGRASPSPQMGEGKESKRGRNPHTDPETDAKPRIDRSGAVGK
jgi:very-short-patch-repair endonuclease